LSGGGAERLVIDLAEFIDKDKFEVSIICLKKGGVLETELKEKNIPCYFISNGKWPLFLSFFKLVVVIKKISPNIVHTHLFGGDFYGCLATRLAGVKNIISTEHNLNFSEGFLKLFLKRLTAGLIKEIVVVSESVKKYLIEKGGIKKEKITVIYNGVKVDKFLKSEKNYSCQDREFVIGSVGRLEKQKGYDILLEAVSRIKELIKCLIAGDGSEKESLEKKIKELGLNNRVQLLGWQKNVSGFLNDLDVFVLPSRWEGFGIVVLEAGLAGLPVIGSRVDGIEEIIKDGENGLLFDSENVDDLAAKILDLKNNETERARLGKNIQKKIVKNFDIRKIVKEYEKLYFSMINKI